MKKLLVGLVWGVFLLMDSVQGAAKGSSDILDFWNNEEQLKSYYGALCTIRGNLEQVLQKEEGGIKSGFETWKKPRELSDRSKRAIFLETLESADSSQRQLFLFYTPFGGVWAMTHCDESVQTRVHDSFLEKMESVWEIEEVTGQAQFCKLAVEDNGMARHTASTQSQHYALYGLRPRVYLLKSLGEYRFVRRDSLPSVFSSITFENDQSDRDAALFGKLSSGTNAF